MSHLILNSEIPYYSMKMKQFLRLLTVLFSLLVVGVFTSCGSGTSSRQEKSIDGTTYIRIISADPLLLYTGATGK